MVYAITNLKELPKNCTECPLLQGDMEGCTLKPENKDYIRNGHVSRHYLPIWCPLRDTNEEVCGLV